MRFISHRGNLHGLNPERENHPDYIDDAVNKGFDVEIDVWQIDDKFWLGHDKPQYEVNISFLRKPYLWCHAKNTEALAAMTMDSKIHCFWHQEDDYTLTSRGYIWVYPGKNLVENCIAVKPESRYENETLVRCSGICSDFIDQYRKVF